MEAIELVNDDCGSDTIQVRQLFCDIWVPNVFSPNGDGLNDVLRILGNIGRIEDVNFSIFNRWGEKIYFTADKYQGWDGFYKGAQSPTGTYAYLVQFKVSGVPRILSGSFHLLR